MSGREVHVDDALDRIAQHVVLEGSTLDHDPADRPGRAEEPAHLSCFLRFRQGSSNPAAANTIGRRSAKFADARLPKSVIGQPRRTHNVPHATYLPEHVGARATCRPLSSRRWNSVCWSTPLRLATMSNCRCSRPSQSSPARATWKAVLPTPRRTGDRFWLGFKGEDKWGNPSDQVGCVQRARSCAPASGLATHSLLG